MSTLWLNSQVRRWKWPQFFHKEASETSEYAADFTSSFTPNIASSLPARLMSGHQDTAEHHMF